MTPAALALARDGDAAAGAAAVALWKSVVGDPDADPVIEAAYAAADWGRYASVALSLVSEHAAAPPTCPATCSGRPWSAPAATCTPGRGRRRGW